MVTLNALQLSDVFFNFPHDNYDDSIQRDFGDKEQEKAAIESALFEDAKIFSDLLDGQVTPQYLVEDFMTRV